MLNRVTRCVSRVAVLGALAFALAGCGINAVPTQDEQVKGRVERGTEQYQAPPPIWFPIWWRP